MITKSAEDLLIQYYLSLLPAFSKLASIDIFRQLADDLDAENFRDRSLGKIPDSIFRKLRDKFLDKYPDPATRPPFFGRNGNFEIPEYFLDVDHMRHLYNKRILTQKYTAREVAELLQNALQGEDNEVRSSYRRPGDVMAILNRHPAPGRHGDTDAAFVSPKKGYAYINSGYSSNYDSLLDWLKPKKDGPNHY